MTAKAGRQVLLSLIDGTESTLIAALLSKSIKFNKAPIDITSDDDSGWRTFLADLDGTRSVDIDCEGVLKSNQVGLLAEGMEDLILEFDIPGIRKVTATFRVTAYSAQGETADKMTFSASFQSSGLVTFAASA